MKAIQLTLYRVSEINYKKHKTYYKNETARNTGPNQQNLPSHWTWRKPRRAKRRILPSEQASAILKVVSSANIILIKTIFISDRRRLKGIHPRSDINTTRADGLSFYYPRLLHCLNQMQVVPDV